MLKIMHVDTDTQRYHVREMFGEYLTWHHSMVSRKFEISFDDRAILEQDMARLHQFAPPEGRLLLGESEGKIAGCACLRKIGEDTGEVKRVYVRPQFRRKGIGRSLLQTIISEARQIGYSKIRLDGASYNHEAQALYRSLGFQYINPYAKSDIPEQYHSYGIFMELILNPR